MKNKIVFAVSLLLIMAVAACKKTEDSPPVVTITEPENGAMIMLPDSIHIEGTASDDKELHEMAVFVTTHMGDTVLAEYPYVHNKKNYSFHYHYATSDTGMYHIKVWAFDHDNGSASKEVMVHVMQ